MVTVIEAAEQLQISEYKVRALLKSGALKAYRVGRKGRGNAHQISESELRDYLRRKELKRGGDWWDQLSGCSTQPIKTHFVALTSKERHLAQKNKLQAIRLVLDRTGRSLQDVKMAVEKAIKP